MKVLFAAAFMTAALTLAPVVAVAQDRVGDAAMGAGSGFLVGGPVGAVVGGVIGYTQGPNIARGMGLHRRHVYYGNRHHASRAAETAGQPKN